MENPIFYQAVGGLVIVFFLVLIYFFTKTWRWFHIVCMVFVFFSTILFIRNVAAVYRTWNTWRTMATRSEIELAKLQEQNDLLRFGTYDDTEQVVESTRLMQAKIGRVILDRGRVWRNCTPARQADGSIVVNTVPPAGAVPPAEVPAPPATPEVPAGGAAPDAAPAVAAAPAGPQPNRIEPQTILYVFLEELPPAETGAPTTVKVPYYYLGDFVAEAVTDTSVTLRPLSPPTPGDLVILETMERANKTWTLHETMPVDGHESFASDPDRQPNLAQPADEEPIFGKIDEQQTRAIMLWPRFLPAFFSAPEVYQAAVNTLTQKVDEYLRDGKNVPVANKDDFPPENVWMEVRFLKPHQEVVDTTGSAVSPFTTGVTDDFFDKGLAEVAILKLGKPAEFKPDDTAVFPQADAQRLISAGICEFREYVYVRPLSDYAYLFKNYERRRDRVNEDQQQIDRNIASYQRTTANLESQRTSANDDQTKLNQDLVKTKDESQKIDAYLATLDEAWKRMREQLSLLYRRNLQLEQELDQLHQEMTDEVNRRIIQSVAEN